MTNKKNSPSSYVARMLMTYSEVTGLKLRHVEDAIASMLSRGELREAYVGRPSHAKAYVVPGDAAPIAGERQKAGDE